MFYYTLIRGDNPSYYDDYFSPDRRFTSILNAIEDAFEFIEFYLDSSNGSDVFRLFVYNCFDDSLVKKVEINN